MAIDGEPKDGDYVRYVEQLINRGQAAPGQVVAKTRDPLSGTPTGAAPRVPPVPPSGAAPPVPPAGAAQERNATLATRASTRRGAFAVTIVALAIGWQAVRMLFEALRRPGFDPHELVPVAFLVIFAGLLWRAARSQRKRAGQPLASLPPLTTISKNGPGNTGR
ncbi:hypothetical protein CAL12_17315 [Bordetella genomosp. 8]|uniref:Uncharacterized protein n=1 Tax=Bordetella genomosp. 8 TaxID=1416806 RepID=A0A1W6YPA3_9BORD|nr:hypothetical protein [Bordetella genomosp. 8]ARP82403.1 hypothetical protein CAL12_17315 [Bordetella genomosp. 8]